MIGKCKKCGGRVISQANSFYVDVVMRVCADCGYVQSAYKRANRNCLMKIYPCYQSKGEK